MLRNSTDRTTGYRPSVPSIVTNFGLAMWRTEAGPAGVRVYAPRFVPWAVALGVVITLPVLVLDILGFVYPTALAGQARNAAATAIVPLFMGFLGIWGAILGGNLYESSRGDLARWDGANELLVLPRKKREIPKADVVRIELATFTMTASYRSQLMRDLVIAWRDRDGTIRYEHLLRNAGGLTLAGEVLARAAGVPFVQVNAGIYDWQTRMPLTGE